MLEGVKSLGFKGQTLTIRSMLMTSDYDGPKFF